MDRIASAFTHKALIAYLTVGYPSVETTLEAVPLLADCGCDIIELGIPFSDPLADGATIQEASYRALLNGVTPEVCLEVAAKLRTRTKVPIVFMSYYNPILRFGLDSFCCTANEAGVDGFIIPDLPPEEGNELEQLSRKYGLHLSYLLAPTSTEERIDLVTRRSSGFVYLVSLAGVTGARQKLSSDLDAFVYRVRQKTTLPLCVGFGISTTEQARHVASIADGVIVGSRIIQLLAGDNPISNVKSFVTGLRQVI
ncbi:MAG: tryptophan synthase subunit alpha [Chloroflexota bacterium]|nr:tryptophan synthase subunit alpha [Chloroflexota bacterium]